MWEYEFLVLKHPGNNGEGPTEKIADGKVLAQSRDHAMMLVGSKLDEEQLADVSKITVQLRKFEDNTGGRY